MATKPPTRKELIVLSKAKAYFLYDTAACHVIDQHDPHRSNNCKHRCIMLHHQRAPAMECVLNPSLYRRPKVTGWSDTLLFANI